MSGVGLLAMESKDTKYAPLQYSSRSAISLVVRAESVPSLAISVSTIWRC